MAVIKCKMCGGDLILTEGSTVAECEYCGTVQTVPNADDEKKLTLFARANRLRAACEFDKAAGLYESIAAEFPDEAEAYWGLILCKYGIEYVDDPATGKKIPTCHRSSFDSVMEDEAFEQVMEYSDINSRRVYREEAKFIEELRKNIIEVSGKEAPYDIFICYKETDPNGERTVDSVMAQEIYDKLTADGYRVFFSRITLEDKLGQEYEPYIFAALNSAKVMLSFGTDYEYYNAVWVKNEWSRFLKLMEKDKSKYLIPCYKGIDAYDMPKEFARLQAQDMGKVGADQDLLRGIRKLLPKQEAKAETVIVQQAAPVVMQQAAPANSTAPLLKRAFMFLEDGAWTSANEYCEKVLDLDPENAEAYLGKLMAELKVSIQENLKYCAQPFDGCDNYQKALRFAAPQLGDTLKGYITFINDRNTESTYQAAIQMLQSADTEKACQAAADAFEKLEGYKDAETQAKRCLEKAEEIKQARKQREAEAERIYVQLIEILDNGGKNETTQDRLAAAKQKKTELAQALQKQLLQVEADKIALQSKIDDHNRQQECLRALMLQKEQTENDISASETQRATLGVFALMQKKELAQKIERLISEKNRIAGEIEEVRKESDALDSSIKQLGSLAEIEARTAAAEKENEKKQKEADKEILRLEAKLAEEQQKGEHQWTLSEIEEEIVSRNEICSYIKYDSQKIKKIAGYSCLPIKLSFLLGTTVRFGTYPQEKNEEIVPIEWRVLTVNDKKALLISEYALDCKKYNPSEAGVTWENCSLRYWLNGTFLNNAFSAEEQAQIQNTTVSADKNPKCSTNPGNATTDKVFLLSINEAEKYFTNDEARKCAPTAYAKAQRAWTHDNYKTSSGEATCRWWLRSPGYTQDYAARVNYDGSVDYYGYSAYFSNFCVRPALWINLDS